VVNNEDILKFLNTDTEASAAFIGGHLVENISVATVWVFTVVNIGNIIIVDNAQAAPLTDRHAITIPNFSSFSLCHRSVSLIYLPKFRYYLFYSVFVMTL